MKKFIGVVKIKPEFVDLKLPDGMKVDFSQSGPYEQATKWVEATYDNLTKQQPRIHYPMHLELYVQEVGLA